MLEAENLEQRIINEFLTRKWGRGAKMSVRIKEVSRACGVAEDLVASVLMSHGYFCDICRNFTTFNHEDAVREYQNNKISIHKLAEKFNTNYYDMYKVLKRHGVKIRDKIEVKTRIPGYRKLTWTGSSYYVRIPAKYIRELGFDPGEELYGKWFVDSGVLRLVISREPLKGGCIKLQYSGRKRKDGKPATRNVVLPKEFLEAVVNKKGEYYGKWSAINNTLVLSIITT